jgi:hypothetical protein
MAVDYNTSNKQKIKNRYNLSRFHNFFGSIDRSSSFLIYWLSQGYHQLLVSNEDVFKMAFKTLFGHYQFKIISFGMTNAPATFQDMMNQIPWWYLGIFKEWRTCPPHEKTLLTFFWNIDCLNITIQKKLQYFVHVLGKERKKIHPAYIEIII